MTTIHDLDDFENIEDLKLHVKYLNKELRYAKQTISDLVHELFIAENINTNNKCLQLDTLPKESCKYYIHLYYKYFHSNKYIWNSEDDPHYDLWELVVMPQEDIIKKIEENASDI